MPGRVHVVVTRGRERFIYRALAAYLPHHLSADLSRARGRTGTARGSVRAGRLSTGNLRAAGNRVVGSWTELKEWMDMLPRAGTTIWRTIPAWRAARPHSTCPAEAAHVA